MKKLVVLVFFVAGIFVMSREAHRILATEEVVRLKEDNAKLVARVEKTQENCQARVARRNDKIQRMTELLQAVLPDTDVTKLFDATSNGEAEINSNG